MNIRTFFQYRLRTFLITVVGVAVVSSWIGINHAEYDREQLAINHIKEHVLAARGRFSLVRSPSTIVGRVAL